MKAYEAIAQSLIAEGVTDFFGLMGDGNMWLWGALCRNPSVKPYNARHESMAVSMADGYTRTTGKIGVAMVTCGPGLTQCGTSLIAAYRGKTPLVLIAGEIEAGSKNSTQTMDQRRFVEASSARFFTLTSLDNMAEEIAEAFYAARTGRGPVVLNLPMGLQENPSTGTTNIAHPASFCRLVLKPPARTCWRQSSKSWSRRSARSSSPAAVQGHQVRRMKS